MPGFLQAAIEQRARQQQLEEQRRIQEETHQRNLLDAMIQQPEGLTSKDVMGLAGSMHSLTPADLTLAAKTADLLRKREKAQKQIAEATDPRLLSTLGAMGAKRPDASGNMVGPAPDEASFRNEALTNQIAAIRNLGLPPDQQQQLQQQIMNTVKTSGMAAQVNAQQALNQKKFESSQQIAQTRAAQSGAEGIRQGALADSSVAQALANRESGMMTDAQLSQLGISPLDQQPPRMKKLVAGFLSENQKWERSVTGKADPEKIKEQVVSADVEDYPGFVPTAKYLRDVSLEGVGRRVRDEPVLTERLGIPTAAGPQFIPANNQKAADLITKDRQALAGLVTIDKQFQNHYGAVEQAQKEGRLAGGAGQTGGMYDVLSTLGVQVPEVRVIQADLFNYSMALLRALRQGRVSDQDMAFQLQTFPSVAELGNKNGRAKLAARQQFLNDQILAPYSPAIRQQLQKQAGAAPKLSAEQSAILAEVRAGKLAPGPEVAQRLMNTIDASGSNAPAGGPAAPAGLVDKY